MENEQVDLFVTKEQLELICNSVEDRRSLWKRTLAYHMGNEDVGGEIEECSHETEADYIVGLYDELHDTLQTKNKEIGANVIEVLAEGCLELSNEIVEVIRLSRDKWSHVAYVYNCRGLEYYFFDSLWDMIQYFDVGKEPDHTFASDAELAAFLRRWRE